MVLVTARFMARRNITRFSSCCEMPSATSLASSSGLRISAMFSRTSFMRHAEDLGDGGAELLDVLALLADHDSRPRRMNGDVGAARGALDVNAAHRRIGELLVQVLAHQEIGVDVRGERSSNPAYHFDVQSRVMPRRIPIGFTF